MGKRMAKVGDGRRVIGYVRVSTEEQSLGPAAQRRALERWCRERDAELVAVHEDRGVSGGAELGKRPGLLEAIDELAREGAGILLVAKRDRLARDTMVAALVQRLAERNGARILSVDGTGNGDGPEAFLIAGMMDLLAQYERLLIRSRTAAALAVKKRRRERVGGVPYGQLVAADGRTLIAAPVEQRAIELAWRLRGEGLSLRAIGRELAVLGLHPRSGGAWHPQTVANILAAKSHPEQE